jgi:hypothetical protein
MFFQMESRNAFRLAFMEQDGDDGQLAFRVGADEVGNHVITAPGHALFAGVTKMELLESVSFVANGDRAGGLSGTALSSILSR